MYSWKSMIYSEGICLHLFQGIGPVVKETLPHRARRKIEREQQNPRWNIPVRVTVHLQVTHIPKTNFYTTWNHDTVLWEHKDTCVEFSKLYSQVKCQKLLAMPCSITAHIGSLRKTSSFCLFHGGEGDSPLGVDSASIA